jgi:hypothetical protein
MVHEHVKVDERQLGLEVGVLGEMPARVRVLRAEALLEAEHVAKRGQARLEVELRALREVRLLPVIVQLEERRAALDLRLDDAGRRDLEQVVRGVDRAEGGHHRRAVYAARSRSTADAVSPRMTRCRLSARIEGSAF